MSSNKGALITSFLKLFGKNLDSTTTPAFADNERTLEASVADRVRATSEKIRPLLAAALEMASQLSSSPNVPSEKQLQALERFEKHGAQLLELLEDNGLDHSPPLLPALNDERPAAIIIAADSEERVYLQELLSERFATIYEATSGLQALEMADRHLPTLIVGDIEAPVVNGFAFTRKLKANLRTSHIPVILLDRLSSHERQAESYRAGADAYLAKSADRALLLSRAANLIESRRLLRERYRVESAALGKKLPREARERQFMQKLVQTIERHMDSPALNAKLVSKQMGMSHSVLYKKIKSATGMTYVEFVRDLKLEVARRLIGEHGFSVADACYKVGYSDTKYFSRQFKQKFGRPPSTFAPVTHPSK